MRRLTYTVAAALLMGAAATTGVPAQPVEWEQFGSEVIARGITFDEADTLWAAAPSEIYHLPPGSDTWVEVNDRRGDALLFTAAGSLIVMSGGLFRSTDRGRTFESVGQRAGGGLYEAPAGPLAGRLFVGVRGVSSELPLGAAFSADDGVTWTETAIGDPDAFGGDANAFLAIPDGEHAGRVVAACYNGLAYSDDGGLSWELSSVWQPFAFAAFAVARLPEGSGPHGGRLLATVDGPAVEDVYASDDGGQTWAPLAVLGPEAQGVRLLWAGETAAGPQTVYAVGIFSDVWRSGDGGRTWEALGNVYPPELTDVNDALIGRDGRLYVTQKQNGPSVPADGVYRTVEPVAVAAEPGAGATAPSSEPMLAVYPNPTAGRATVTLALPKADEVRATVYDVLGREIAVIHDGPLAMGTHELAFDTGELPAGVYVVRAAGAGILHSQRLTVVR